MLTKVEIVNRQGDVLTLPLDDVSQGFVVQNIDGLDPVKATLNSSNFAGLDGAQYQSSSLGTRNITMNLGLKPVVGSNQTVRNLRSTLYTFLIPKAQVTLRFYDSDTNAEWGSVVEIVGVVESCEAPLFAQEPEADISIICYDPAFIDTTPVVPFTGQTTADDRQYFWVDGTSDAGITMVLTVNRALPEFTIYYWPPTGELLQMDFTAPLETGDVLTINTTRGSKSITLTRSGSDVSAIYGLTPTSPWIQLQHGDNYFQVYADGAGVPWTMSFLNKYGGL